MQITHLPIAISRTHVRWLVVVAAALVVAAIAIASLRARFPLSNTVAASGTIEVTQSDVAPKVEGRLVALRVKDGDRVKRGQLLAVLEPVEPALNLDQARAAAAAADAQVAAAQAAYTLQSDTYSAGLAQANEGVAIAQSTVGQAGESLAIESHAAVLGVDQATAQVRSAEAAYERAHIELARTRSLVGTGDLAQSRLDDAIAQFRAATSGLQTARDALALAQADQHNVRIRELGVGTSRAQHRQSVTTLGLAQAQSALVAQHRAQLLAAQSQAAQARAALGIAENRLRETRITAPFDGFVIAHNFEVGDLIGPGSPVMTIGDLTHPYVYVYVSETEVPHVKTGMRADVSIDGVPGRTFAGTVTEIGNAAEFTPENIQTKEQRIEYLVFRVKIQFTDTTGTLKPGLPVDGTIHL